MQPTIGLEIHTQLATKTKMFCGCVNVIDGAEPNVYVCPVCLGMPGSLPVVNERAVEMAIMAGLALESDIAEFSKFDRKNYFYPDLPKGYQISQFDKPICVGGKLKIQTSEGEKTIRLRRIHLEEDAAKATHPKDSDYSLIDFNRAGTPLIESVTEPDMHSAEEARIFAQEFRRILRYLHVSNADMEKGQLRVDVNVSVQSDDGRTTPVAEVKNVNSFRSIERAVKSEIERHTAALEAGEEGKMKRETRGWIEAEGKTVSQRSKEEANDYRYFPEPDLPPLEPSKKLVATLKGSLPELPAAMFARFVEEYGLDQQTVLQLVADQAMAHYFEQVATELSAWFKVEGAKVSKKDLKNIYKDAANWLLGELTKHLKKGETKIEDVRITPENFAEFLKMLLRSELNSSAAQTVLARMFLGGEDPSDVARDENLLQMSDEGDLEAVVDKVISDNPEPVADVKAGKTKALQALIGMVMKETKGKANPGIVQKLLKKRLS